MQKLKQMNERVGALEGINDERDSIDYSKLSLMTLNALTDRQMIPDSLEVWRTFADLPRFVLNDFAELEELIEPNSSDIVCGASQFLADNPDHENLNYKDYNIKRRLKESMLMARIASPNDAWPEQAKINNLSAKAIEELRQATPSQGSDYTNISQDTFRELSEQGLYP